MACWKCRIHKLPQMFEFQIPADRITLIWSIDEAMDTIMRLHLRQMELNLANMSEWLDQRIELDHEHVDHVDMAIPVIILTLDGGAIVLDGNHRLAKAMREGRKTFPAFFLREKDLEPFARRPMTDKEMGEAKRYEVNNQFGSGKTGKTTERKHETQDEQGA